MRDYSKWLSLLEKNLSDGSPALVFPVFENYKLFTTLKIVVNGIINQKVLLLKISSSDKRNIIVHPYLCRLINEGDIELLGYYEHTGKIQPTRLSQITDVSILDTIEYRKIEGNDINAHPYTASEGTFEEIRSARAFNMRSYWNAFNAYMKQKGTEYQVGNRKDYYNQLITPRFKRDITPNSKKDTIVYFELLFQPSGRERDRGYAIIKIIVQGSDYEKVHKRLERDYKNKIDKFPKFKWTIAEGKRRKTIQCAREKFGESVDVENEPNQQEHFQWFKKQLDELTEIFKDFISH